MTSEANKKTPWKTTDSRFVAFIDILGFKDLVMRNSHEDIYNLLNNISKIRQTIENATNRDDTPSTIKDAEVYIVNFSDSIVIFSKNDNLENFILFLHSVNWLVAKSIEKSIPLKGGISHGVISLNKSSQIYFGQPIIDAYLLEEEVNYLGVVAHSSIDNYIEQNKIKNDRNRWFENITPLKCGNINHINLNWFDQIKSIDKKDEDRKEKVISTIKSFRLTVSGSPRRYIDNTLKFFEETNTTHNILYK